MKKENVGNDKLKKFIGEIGNFNPKIIEMNGTSHILVNEDALKILKLIPNNFVNLIVTDPPYNIGLDYGVVKDRMKKKEYFEWCKEWLREFARILKSSGALYLISYPEINAYLMPFIDNELKLRFRRWLTWHYPTNIGHSSRNFTRSQRSILFYTKSDEYIFHKQYIIQHYKNPEVKKIQERLKRGFTGRGSYDLLRFTDIIELNKKINGENIIKFLDFIQKSEGLIDVLDFNLLKNVSKDRVGTKKEGDKFYHPCQLPLGLISLLMKISSNKGMLVLDPFAGTFTVSAVAADLCRNSIGIEKNPYFLELGWERLKSHRGKK